MTAGNRRFLVSLSSGIVPPRAALPLGAAHSPRQVAAIAAFAVYLTKLRYEASASTWFSDNLLEMLGIGGPAAA